jgi:hypothetical protein
MSAVFFVHLFKIGIMYWCYSNHLLRTLLLLMLTVFARDLSSQVTWNEPIDVAPSSFGNVRPRITNNASGNPLLIWGKSSDLMYSRWDGSAFTTPVRLNPSGVTIASATWMGPELAAHGDTIYIVYKQTPEDLVSSHIWLLRSFDGGNTFLAPVQVENTGTDKSRFPTVTTDDEGHPIIAFMRFNQSFHEARWVVTRSYDFGETFTTDVLASGWSSQQSEVCDCCPGTIHSSGDNVVVVYRDNNENLRDSWAGVSSDGGLTFTRGVNIDQNGWMIEACPATGPDAVIIGDTLYSTFMSAASGQALVFHNQTAINDLSTPPSTPVPGSGEALQQNFSRFASSGNAAALLWRHSAEFSTGLALMFTNDITNGFPGSFDTLAYSLVVNGDVAVTEKDVLVAWQDNGTSKVKFRSGTYETSTGIEEEIKSNPLAFYPNPVSDELILHKVATQIRISDMSGRVILTGKGNRMDVRSLSSGIYLITTEDGWGKFLKN